METKITNLNKESIVKVIKKVLDENKKRNFIQTIDVGVNLKGINFKQPQNRINLVVQLPNPFKSKPKVVLFAKDKNLISQLKDVVDKVLTDEEIVNLEKKDAKRLARDYDLFFAEPSVMALVGKHLGQILAPRGKMPKPAPPNPNAIKVMIDNEVKNVKISNKKGKYLPTLHFAIGKENMDLDKLAENFMVCYNKLLDVLPGKTQNLKSIYIKTTMGKPVYVYRK